jgi:hypothetical protein
MSIRSWKKEFAPGSIKEISKRTGYAILQWCLHKWIGLRKENLQKHNLRKDGFFLCGKTETYSVNATTCPLCLLSMRHDCENCPIYEARGDVSCDDTRDYEDYSPFVCWVDTGDPEPMIDAIRDAMDM